MGRWIQGDIEAKFWVGIQPSDAADRFGVIGVQPEELYYYFQKEDLESVETEIEVIEKKLDKYLPLMVQFFTGKDCYSDEKLATALGITTSETKILLRDYADLELGRLIRDCIKEQGSCEFTAEC